MQNILNHYDLCMSDYYEISKLQCRRVLEHRLFNVGRGIQSSFTSSYYSPLFDQDVLRSHLHLVIMSCNMLCDLDVT